VRYKASGMCTELDPAACAACATPSPNVAQRFVSTQSVRLYRHIAAQALSQHKTIFVSEAIRSNAARVLPASAFARSWVIHNFIDQARLSRDTQGLAPHADPGQPWQVLIASRLDEAKGVAPFLAQWARQRPAHTRLLLVGDGPDRLQMEALYAGPGVEFLKHQPYETTLKLTASSHAAVVPSLCEEACSTTILEALYLGVLCAAPRRQPRAGALRTLAGSASVVQHGTRAGSGSGATPGQAASAAHGHGRSGGRPVRCACRFAFYHPGL
jgi:glycogen(starch) synthase